MATGSDMRMKLTVALALLFIPAMAAAQDVGPVLDLPTLAQGQVISSTAKSQARRGTVRRSARPTAAQIEACASRPRFRREYGADNPEVRQLERLCRGVGL